MKTLITPGMFAKVTHDAMDRYEKSWVNGRYTLEVRETALQACVSNGVDPEWAGVVHLMVIGTWNEADEWVKAHLPNAEENGMTAEQEVINKQSREM